MVRFTLDVELCNWKHPRTCVLCMNESNWSAKSSVTSMKKNLTKWEIQKEFTKCVGRKMWFNLTQRMKRRWEITATFIFLNQNERITPTWWQQRVHLSLVFFSCCLPDFFSLSWIIVDCVDESVLFCVPLRFTLESSTLEHMFMFYNEHKRARESEREGKIKRPPQMHEYLKLIRNQWASMSTLHRLRVNLKNSLYSFFFLIPFSQLYGNIGEMLWFMWCVPTLVSSLFMRNDQEIQYNGKKDNYIPQVLHIQIIWSHTKLYENFNCNLAVVIFFPTSCSIRWQSGWMTFFRVSFFIYCAIYLIFICNEEFGWEFNTKYSH